MKWSIHSVTLSLLLAGIIVAWVDGQRFTAALNYDNPNRTVLVPNPGRIFSAGPPRQIQFGVRFIF